MTRDPNRWIIIAVIIILVSGFFLTLWAAQAEDNRLRTQLLTETRLAEQGIPVSQVARLTGSETDLMSQDYRLLKAQMAKIRSIAPLVRFTYLMGRRPDGSIFLFIDSEQPDSEDYSPPGEEYPEASDILKNTFLTGKDTTEGPLSDRWGTWVSGFIPVKDPETGRIIAVFGMDVDALDWNRQIATATTPAVAGTLVILGLVLIFLFIRKRDEQERRLLQASEAVIRMSESRLNLAIDAANLGLWDYNLVNNEIVHNSKWAEMLGYSGEDLNKPALWWQERVHPDDLPTVSRNSEDHTSGKTPYFEAIYRMKHKNGEWRWVHSHGKVILRDSTGSPIRMMGINEDITERKQMEVALFQANKRLNLLSSVTRHDILNQLMALRAYIELSRGTGTDPHRADIIDKEESIAEIIERQIRFTGDYQDMGVKAPSWQNINEIIIRAKEALPMRRVKVETDRIDFEALTDPLFEKVFYNLFDNVLRHGGDQVTTIRVFSQETKEGLVIFCEDDGVGISLDDKKHLFERGFGKNTGFGLFISREILSITGISITETGIPGKGARFEMLVPKDKYRVAGSSRT
jgi:PAS domain S-box-containing protein